MSIVYSGLDHPLRVPLAAEVHSRPFLRLNTPETLTHLAVFARQDTNALHDNSALQHETLTALCAHYGVAGPAPEAKYFYHDFGKLRLKWECHTEFATYTFAEQRDDLRAPDNAFEHAPLHNIPQQWLLGLAGKVMVAAHVVLDRGGAGGLGIEPSHLRKLFEGSTLVGSTVQGGAELCTDFLIQSDGFSRFVVRDISLQDQQAGRLVQRLLEMETYRMMALLGLPHAQKATPVLNAIEDELAALTVAMVDSDTVLQNEDKEQALLRQITGLAARIERLSLDNSYRFSASQAYFRLVNARIDEMRETRMDGMQTVAEFMDRRLAPAMNTCAAVARRQEALAARIANTNDLLRTRVGIVQEQQNRKILHSMNTRAAQQLRLQQAVEGLSVAAITYYVAGLVNYAGKAAKAAGLPINPDLATGIMIPVVAVAVWYGVRRLHRKMTRP